MSAKTKIEWTVGRDGEMGATWNPVRGCSEVSPGCRECYARRIAARFSAPGQPFHGFATRSEDGRGRWTGKVALVREHLEDPIKWRKPRRVFVNSMTDLFHENLSFDDIDLVFAVMARAVEHTFLVLTKRAERMRDYVRNLYGSPGNRAIALKAVETLGWSAMAHDVVLERVKKGLDNVWLGVSIENQETADERLPFLAQTPASVRFVSYEPALGPVDFGLLGTCLKTCDVGYADLATLIDWILIGGESGPDARPFHVEWARSAIKQCRDADVHPFVKQLGSEPRWDGTADADERFPDSVRMQDVGGAWKPLLKDRKGGDMDEWPVDLRVREFTDVG